ncbi:MAG: adenylate kinase family protein [Candidatus Nanoarchaeia archaeon]
MKLIFIGPQGSGKGTQAKAIARKLAITHISTGELLRKSDNEEIKQALNKGELIPDELMINLLKGELDKCERGFILDGFPRNINQAEKLDNITDIDKIILMDISDEEAIRRLQGRRICKQCNVEYNIITSPRPEQDEICDFCHNKLEKREDDNEEAIKTRLKAYHNKTEPLLAYYKDKLIKINGEQPIKQVTQAILSNLGMLV